MNHVKFKVFFAWQHEKEERWLNKMSKQGLELIGVGFCRYIFKENKEEEFEYKLEFMNDLPSNYKSHEYIRFLEETGIEFVGSFFRWAYFKKKSSEVPFEIFSDIESRVSHYKRIRLLLIGITPLNIANSINILSRYFDYGSLKFLGMGILFVVLSVVLVIEALLITMKIGALNKERDFTE